MKTKEVYVITSNGNRPGYYLGVSQMDRYRQRNFIGPLYRQFDGRLGACDIQTFESEERARAYLDGGQDLIPRTWKICTYDPCLASITGEVKEVKSNG